MGALIFPSKQHYLIYLIQQENQIHALNDMCAQNLKYADIIAVPSGGGHINFPEVESEIKTYSHKILSDQIKEVGSAFYYCLQEEGKTTNMRVPFSNLL